MTHYFHICPRKTAAFALLTGLVSSPLVAQESVAEQDVVEVIGITPTHGVGLPEKVIPYNIQSATSEDIERSTSLDLADYMNRNLGSVTINDAQNNPLQRDVQFRGFTLSPLLGLPQGLSVFQDGIRINEPFGDSMNWDLVPESSIASINLVGGANPIFGLNTLGGALSITTKDGFTNPGHSLEVYGGSFERVVTTIESGGNNGTWGYYITGNYFDEEGWRDASESDALNVFGKISYRSLATTLDLGINHGRTDLIGNGAIPVELMDIDREAVFTSPDQTENDMFMLNLEGTHWLTDLVQLSGNAFYRNNETDTFNGDGSEFEECLITDIDPANEILIEADEDDLDDAGLDCTAGFTEAQLEAAGGEVPEDQFGSFFLAENANGSERNAVNNLSTREQEGFGGTFQTTFLHDLFGRQNQFLVGAAYQQGIIDFNQATEIATLACEFDGSGTCELPGGDRGTVGSGLFAVEEGTAIKSHNRTWSLYFSNTFQYTDKLALTVSARYNNSSLKLGDRSNSDPLVDPDNPQDLNGEHDYNRINPAVGATYAITDAHNVYGSYSESSRAPTPIELLCADPNAPCSLPNAFLADPPLDQVVTKSFEGGFRGGLPGGIRYSVGGFRSTNNDDIIFTSTGGVGSNEGFFQNVGQTRRIGAELSLQGNWQQLGWFLNYGFVRATFETPFQAASANHPLADANGEIFVDNGDRIPGVPEHSLKVGAEYPITSRLTIGGDLVYNSDQHLRGDEANLLDTVDDYAVVNIRGRYRINDNFSLFARVNNLFDTDYETFGLLGEPDEVFSTFSDNRFFGPGAPISGFVGIRVDL